MIGTQAAIIGALPTAGDGGTEYQSSPASGLALLQLTMTTVSRAAEHLSAPLLRPREVANLLGVSLPTVYRLIDRREIAFMRVGGRLRFSRADVESYIAERRIDPVSSYL